MKTGTSRSPKSRDRCRFITDFVPTSDIAPDKPADEKLSNKTRDEVRQLLYSKATRDEIMERLGLSFRTYLQYVEAIREQDSRFLGNDNKSVAWEFKKAYGRLNTIVERCCEVIDDPEVPSEIKVKTLRLLTQTSIAMIELANDARSALRE